MGRIVMTMERTKDLYDAYSENCEGIYGAGSTLEELKSDVLASISQIKDNLAKDRWPDPLKDGEVEVVYCLKIPSSE